MRDNYVIFKGVSSKEIPGLIIQELPAISRPKMRTEKVVIDGRDGDIIDELGYQSYTKTMSIGLNTDADIDEVMNYFNGRGKIIFSNEPDKEYTVIMDDKIDYNRLVKYRTANVKMYAQPYKYLVDEAPFVITPTNETSFMVSNQGLIDSKPIITIWGTGTITISIDGSEVFSLDMDDNVYITVDSLEQEAYKNGVLKNRQMSGQFPVFKPGVRTISWSGSLTKLKVEPKSRWL